MVHGLLLGEAGDGGQHAKGVTAQQDEVLGVGAHAGDPGVVDELDGVRRTCVLRHGAADRSLAASATHICHSLITKLMLW